MNNCEGETKALRKLYWYCTGDPEAVHTSVICLCPTMRLSSSHPCFQSFPPRKYNAHGAFRNMNVRISITLHSLSYKFRLRWQWAVNATSSMCDSSGRKQNKKKIAQSRDHPPPQVARQAFRFFLKLDIDIGPVQSPNYATTRTTNSAVDRLHYLGMYATITQKKVASVLNRGTGQVLAFRKYYQKFSFLTVDGPVMRRFWILQTGKAKQRIYLCVQNLPLNYTYTIYSDTNDRNCLGIFFPFTTCQTSRLARFAREHFRSGPIRGDCS